MAPKVERITEIPNLELGEGPHWDIATQSLYLVDIHGKTIYKYVPSTGQQTQITFEKPVSFIIPVKSKRDQFIISLERELNIITWDGQSQEVSNIEKIAEVDQGTGNRINDGKVDPSGRLWAGTMGPEPERLKIEPERGSLFSLNNSGEVAYHVDKIGISNGLAWNKDRTKLYYVDSFKGSVDAFDFDIVNGTISNRTPIFTVSKHDINGLPDGLTIDVDGNLWVAVFNSYSVVKIDPRIPETLLQTVKIPALQVTSVAWGGIDLDVLFVTSGSFTVDGEELSSPNDGATFKVTGLGTKGLPADNFVL